MRSMASTKFAESCGRPRGNIERSPIGSGLSTRNNFPYHLFDSVSQLVDAYYYSQNASMSMHSFWVPMWCFKNDHF